MSFSVVYPVVLAVNCRDYALRDQFLVVLVAEYPLVLAEDQRILRLVRERSVRPLRQYDDAVEAGRRHLTRTIMQCVGVNLDRLTLLDEERDSLRRIELTVLDIVELREDKNEIGRRDVDLGVLVPLERVQVRVVAPAVADLYVKLSVKLLLRDLR